MKDPKGKIWLRIKKQKISEFAKRNIVKCEMCYGLPPEDFERQVLDLAHSKKRRFIQNELEMAEVALLCRKCHNFVEYKMSHEEMYKTITDIIKRRDGLEAIFDE